MGKKDYLKKPFELTEDDINTYIIYENILIMFIYLPDFINYPNHIITEDNIYIMPVEKEEKNPHIIIYDDEFINSKY